MGVGRSKKIALVAGDLDNPRLLTSFQFLAQLGAVTVFAFNKPRVMEQHRSTLKLSLFESVSEMPGYMRGLEAELEKVDLVVVVESHLLASFQAARAAHKQGIPLICFYSDEIPFRFAEYANIRAIQDDMFRNAAMFLVPSEKSQRALEAEGVESERIFSIKPKVDRARFKFEAKRATKFRSHVGLSENDIVCLYQAPMVLAAQHLDLVRALDYLRRTRAPLFPRLKMIFAGIGPLAHDIKYKCVDLGLGGSVFFLHQDTDAFAQDLLAATDVYIAPPPVADLGAVSSLPLGMMEAISTGCLPLVVKNSVAEEFSRAGNCIATSQFEFSQVAIAIREAQSVIEEVSQKRHSERSVGDYEDHDNVLLVRLNGLLIEDNSRKVVSVRVEEIEAWVRSGRFDEASVAIEDFLLRTAGDRVQQSILLRLKGDLLLAKGVYDEAANVLSDATHLDETNYMAFRSLGYLSLQSHMNEDALTFFRKALALSDDDPRTILGVGLALKRLSLFDEAVFWLERAVDFEQVRGTALPALLQASSQCPRSGKAIEALTRVMEVVGEKPALLLTLGQLQIRRGNIEEGQRLLQKAAA